MCLFLHMDVHLNPPFTVYFVTITLLSGQIFEGGNCSSETPMAPALFVYSRSSKRLYVKLSPIKLYLKLQETAA